MSISKLKTLFLNNTRSEKDLVRAISWNFIGNGIGKLSIVVSSIFVARLIGPETLGKWAFIRSTSAMFSIVLGFGVAVTAVKYVAEFRELDKDKTGNILGVSISFAFILGIVLASVNYLSSDYFANSILNEKTILLPLQISSLFLLFIALNGVISGSLAGLNCFSSIAISNFISGILGTPIIIILSFYYGLNGLVIGYLCYYLITFFVLSYFLKKRLNEYGIKISISKYRSNLSIILNHNLPAILSGGIGGGVVWVISIFVAKLESGFTILGINDAAKIVQNTVMELSAQIDLPLISFLSSSKESKRNDKINLFVPIVFCTIFILPLIYFPDLIELFFNKSDFADSDFCLVLSLSMLTTYVMVYKRGLGRIIITKNFMWWGVYENLFWAILVSLFIYFFVPKTGSIGYALSFALAYLIDLIVIIPFYYRKGLINKTIGFSKEIWVIWIIVISGSVSIYIDLNLFLRIIFFIFCFIISLLALRRIYYTYSLS